MNTPHSHIPGQATLPDLIDDLGYETIKLNPKQEKFCWEFILKNGNATASYMAAFPDCKPISAKSNAARLLKEERIQQRLEEIRAELQKRYAVSAGSLVLYLSQALHLDRRDFLDENGDPKAAHLLDTETAKIIDLDFVYDSKSGKQKAIYRIPTRLQAAVELARMMGLHKDKVEVTGDGSTPENTLTALIHEITGNTRNLVNQFDGMTDDQLKKHARATARKVLDEEAREAAYVEQ
jgi:phage terminase small subunit